MIRVLVTGAGGPAGVAVIRSLLRRPDVELFSADMDGWASGLYLVPAQRRRIIEPGAAPGFTDSLLALCREDSIDVLFSTVDIELRHIAPRKEEFVAQGTAVASPSDATISVCLDKFALAERCAPLLTVPTTRLLTTDGKSHNWEFPVIIKPRSGAGSRGVRLIEDRLTLDELDADEQMIIQENLPGAEFSVDVLSDLDGRVICAVPRTRERVDSGVSIAGRTVKDPALIETATAVARAIGLTGVANVQLRYNSDGEPALLEVNPRFPGAMPLTIAAGADMPSLLLDIVRGTPIPDRVDFAELANVRFLEDVFVPVNEIIHSEHNAHPTGIDEG